MAASKTTAGKLNPPSPSRQIAFHQLLIGARKAWLGDALAEALAIVDPLTVKTQMLKFAPSDAQKIVAAAGIRDEQIFPVPVVLQGRPTLVGYYRLLLGASQKSFYRSGTGMALFKSMEMLGTITARQEAALPEFCKAMGKALAQLVREVSPVITPRDVDELRLLTLGSQFQGGNNVSIGKQATADVFLAVSELVYRHTTSRLSNALTVTNSAGRTVTISLATDPDIRIVEEVAGQIHRRLAIEIKGGTDNSNAHNRAGEAEKSHQKARSDGFPECWTIIALKRLDQAKLRRESPTTNHWFDVAQILGRIGPQWEDFRGRLASLVGIPVL